MSWVAGWNETSQWVKDGSIRLGANRPGSRVQVTKPQGDAEPPPATAVRPHGQSAFGILALDFTEILRPKWMPMLAPWDLVVTVP